MGKRGRFLTALTGAMLIFSLQPDVKAEMYVCVDAAGKEQYTNMTTAGNCRPLMSRARITRRPGDRSAAKQAATFRQRASRDPSSYDHHISQVSRRYNVDPYLIKAVIKAESDFDCYALSKKGAQGLMQLMPATARELKVRNPFNPHENIDGGTRYLRNMLDTFDGNVALSLAAYNAGPTLVKRLQKIPRIPETKRYVRKVLEHYKRYRGSIPQSQVRLAASNKK
jgi:soluble lytic murein transglycosylase-like protein